MFEIRPLEFMRRKAHRGKARGRAAFCAALPRVSRINYLYSEGVALWIKDLLFLLNISMWVRDSIFVFHGLMRLIRRWSAQPDGSLLALENILQA
jgi:hypothetical protein